MATEEAPRSPLARGVIAYLTSPDIHPFASLKSVWSEGNYDLLEIELEPQLPQVRHVPIKNREVVRIRFHAEDGKEPRIYAVREDFPQDLVHTNYDPEDHGRCLCVWEESWHDLSRTLTPQQLIERIRGWLARTARGELHAPGQPLEPLIPQVPSTLILPAGTSAGPWHIHGVRQDLRRTVVWLDTTPPEGSPDKPFAMLSMDAPAQVHGALHGIPQSVAELAELMAELQVDFLDALKTWLKEPDQRNGASKLHALFLIAIPRKSGPEAEPEAVQILAFSPGQTLAELGTMLGVTATHEVDGVPTTVTLVGVTPADECGTPDIRLDSWRVVHRLNRQVARRYAAVERADDAKLVAVGAGAIGSNVIINTGKTGVGTWTVIDDDIVLPHNTVRQTQGDQAVGFAKVHALRIEADAQLAEEGHAEIQADILAPGDQQGTIEQAIAEADITFDFSASLAVVGHLADLETAKRVASLFFNPDGTDLVLLAEDADRAVRLDDIEAHYFWAAASDERMDGHFSAARADRIRYANACQDLTRPLPPWQVQTLSAIASGEVMKLLDADAAKAAAWRLDPTTAGVTNVPLDVVPFHQLTGNFTVRLSQHAVDLMRALRLEAAPNETGGVLIGTYDLSRRVLHIVGVLEAPEDSVQKPTYFVRGSSDLVPLVEDLAIKSAGRLHYVGEWHSHPNHSPAQPSDDDEEVFAYLKRHIEPGGSPYAMIICGQKVTWARVGWQHHGIVEGDAVTYDQ